MRSQTISEIGSWLLMITPLFQLKMQPLNVLFEKIK